MKKLLILSPLMLLLGCLEVGTKFHYSLDPLGTSSVIANSSIDVVVSGESETDLEFTADVLVKPIVGQARTEHLVKQLPKELLSEEVLEEVRAGRVIETPNFHLQFDSNVGSCEVYRVDHIPPTEDIRDLVVKATLCGSLVKFIDSAFISKGRNIKIGYKLEEGIDL